MKKHAIAALSALAFVALPAAASAAAVTAAANVNVGVTASGTTANVSAGAKFETNAKSRADKEINRRVENLNQLSQRVGEMTKLSADQKASLESEISAQITALTNLKTQIDAETNLTNLKGEVQSITKSYRVYMIMVPQMHITAEADRVGTIADQMAAIGEKLKVRLDAASTTDAAYVNAYNDMQAKIADAKTQASAAVSLTAGLKADNGDKTVAAANAAAVKQARADLKAAMKDLQAARHDIATLAQGIHLEAKGSAEATTSAEAQ